MKHPKTCTAVITIVIIAAAAIALGLVVMFTGVYNVAAVGSHSSLADWVLDTTMTNSVVHQAESVTVPADFDKIKLDEGAEHYAEMCIGCHGAPGVERHEMVKGMHPEPPRLVEHADDWTPAQLFWIVSNGVDSTGMPGFSPTHSAEKRWAIVALTHRLPKMTPAEFKNLSGVHSETAQSKR